MLYIRIHTYIHDTYTDTWGVSKFVVDQGIGVTQQGSHDGAKKPKRVSEMIKMRRRRADITHA